MQVEWTGSIESNVKPAAIVGSLIHMKMDARVAGILSIRIIAGRKLKPMTPGSLL